jgi:hypothetical protein
VKGLAESPQLRADLPGCCLCLLPADLDDPATSGTVSRYFVPTENSGMKNSENLRLCLVNCWAAWLPQISQVKTSVDSRASSLRSHHYAVGRRLKLEAAPPLCATCPRCEGAHGVRTCFDIPPGGGRRVRAANPFVRRRSFAATSVRLRPTHLPE